MDDDGGWVQVKPKPKRKRKKKKRSEPKPVTPEGEWTTINDVPSDIRDPRFRLQQVYLDTRGNEVRGAAETMCLKGYALYEMNGYALRGRDPIISERTRLNEVSRYKEALLSRCTPPPTLFTYLEVSRVSRRAPNPEYRRREKRNQDTGCYYIVYHRHHKDP